MKKTFLNYLLGGYLIFLSFQSMGQYCTPTTGTNGCTYGDYISNVVFGAISNATGCNGPLANYTSMSTIVYTDSSYSAYVSLNPDFNQGIGIFIDWNQDQDFNDAGEFYSNGNITNYGATETIQIVVPANALPGTTHMRVGCQYANVMTASNACATIGNYGEYEEYSLVVKQTLPYSDSITANGVSAILNLGNFSTCQETVMLNAASTTDNGTTWVSGTYNVSVNGSLIGSYNGSQLINLSAYIPVSTVTLASTESGMTNILGTVSVISSGSSNPNPGPQVTDLSYCIGDSTTALNATMQGNGTVLKWFTSAEGYGYSSVAPTPSTSVADTVYFWVSQADASGCESLRSKISVITHDLPGAPIALDQSFCSGSVADLLPATSSSVRWYDDSLSTIQLADTFMLTSASYFVDTVDAYGCVSPKTEILVSLLVNSGEETVNACDSYIWNSNGMTYTVSGNYIDTLTNVAGCDSVVTLNLTINANPTVIVTNNGDGTYTASGADTYQWFDCQTQVAIQGVTTATFAPAANGSYYAEGTTNGCYTNSTCVDLTDLGISEELISTLLVHPNPTNGVLYVNNSEPIEFTITNAQGQLVSTGNLLENGQIDCTGFSNGLYLIHFEVNGKETVRRFAKQ